MLDGAELDALIARQVEVFAERGERFEWKLHGHDLPADLPERLRAAGFAPEEVETVVIAPVDAIAGDPLLPDGASLREVVGAADFDRIAAMEEAVWGDDSRGWLAESLEKERAADPDAISIVVVEAGSEVVCAAWVRFEGGTDFATLWGGGTLPAWRGRGIYKAMVAYRANLARERGYRFVQVDASDGQPADPRAARIRRRDDDDALRLVARRRHTLTTIFPCAWPSPMTRKASATSSNAYPLSIAGVIASVSRRSRRTSMSVLLNFAMKKTTVSPANDPASRILASAAHAAPSRRLPFGAPTMTSVAFGSSTRLHSDHGLLPATSSSRS